MFRNVVNSHFGVSGVPSLNGIGESNSHFGFSGRRSHVSVVESRNVIHVTLGENRLITVDLSGDLFNDIISGTPTAAETTSLGLSCGTCVVNDTEITVENKNYATRQAVQVRVDCRNATLPTGATEAEAKVRITYNAADRGGPHTHDVKLVVHA